MILTVIRLSSRLISGAIFRFCRFIAFRHYVGLYIHDAQAIFAARSFQPIAQAFFDFMHFLSCLMIAGAPICSRQPPPTLAHGEAKRDASTLITLRTTPRHGILDTAITSEQRR